MRQATPPDSRYVPLTQQKWLCVPTCIQMIMVRNNIPLVPSELLGSYTGLLVPEKDKRLFWKVEGAVKKPKSGYGTQISEKSGVNKAFKDLKIPLRMDWKLIDQFEDIKDFKKYLDGIRVKGIDILVCFDWGSLFDKRIRQGHVCVLDKVYFQKQQVRMIDPEYDVPKWRLVKMEKLFRAMKEHGWKNSGGFWEFSVVKKKD